jgi:hypothetical protein
MEEAAVTLNDAEWLQFQEWVNAKHGRSPACPICKTQEWDNWGNTMLTSLLSKTTENDMSRRTLELYCKTCGYVMYFAPDIIGLVSGSESSS